MGFQPPILRPLGWALAIAVIGTVGFVGAGTSPDFPQRASITYLEDLDGDGQPELLVVDEAAATGRATPSFGIYELGSVEPLALSQAIPNFRLAEPLFSASSAKTSSGFAVHHQQQGSDWVTSFGISEAELQWQTRLPGATLMRGTLPWRIVTVGDILLAASGRASGQLGNRGQATVAVTRLETHTGRPLWTQTLSYGVAGFVPIAAERNVLVSESGRTCVLLRAADGHILKRMACEGVVPAPSGVAVYGAGRAPEFGHNSIILTRYNARDQAFVPVLRGGAVVQLAGAGLAFTADGQTLVSHDGRRHMWAYDVTTGKRRWVLDTGDEEVFDLPIRSWRHPHRSLWQVLQGRFAPLKLTTPAASRWRLVALDLERGELEASTGAEASLCALVGAVATGQWVLWGGTLGQRQTLVAFDTRTGTISAALGARDGNAGLILPADMSPTMVYGPYVALSGVRGTTVVRLDGKEPKVVFESHPELFGVSDFNEAMGTLQLRPLGGALRPATRR